MSDGRVVGNVQQGNGIDDFRISGGQVGSLSQGDNLDTFTMSGGRIVDAFDDGDRAVMTGGRIGRVNMKLDNNFFDMSGGTIDRNLVTGFGNDTIILSDGTIGGNISVSGGTDSVTVTGGTVGGDIRMSFGTDAFAWSGAASSTARSTWAATTIPRRCAISMMRISAPCRDLRRPRHRPPHLRQRQDRRRWRGSTSGRAIDLTNDSEVVFGGTLTLGTRHRNRRAHRRCHEHDLRRRRERRDRGLCPGRARVRHQRRAHRPYQRRGRVRQFTIAGDYAGDDGLLFVDTVLGDDASPSDKLVMDGGTASGTTGVSVVEAGGSGDATTQDGIMVVEAVNGATTDSGAFALTGRVAAGAYEYFLFKGGVSAGTEENWYLRSTLVTPPPADPTPPEPAPAPDPLDPPVAEPQPEAPEIAAATAAVRAARGAATLRRDRDDPPGRPDPAGRRHRSRARGATAAPPPAEPADPPPPPPALPTLPAPVPSPRPSPGPPPTPGATPVVAEVVPLYRVEVAAYSAIPPVAHYLALSTLGTFHERRGEQALLRGAGTLPAAWGRAFGQHADLAWGGTVEPSVEGNLFGFQVGQDILGRESDSGHSTASASSSAMPTWMAT